MDNNLKQLIRQYFRYCKNRRGFIVPALIFSINNVHVGLRTGLKSDSFVSIEEFSLNERQIFKVGDFVPVLVSDTNTQNGDVIVSYAKAQKLICWSLLKQALEQKLCIAAYVAVKVKGGVIVVVHGLRAFLPGSLLNLKSTQPIEITEGQQLSVHVVKLDIDRGNIVVSRRSVLEAAQHRNKLKLITAIENGEVIRGVVKNITDYGAFIDLGGIDGLLHITDMSWRRIKHPSNVLSLGDSIMVKVLKFDKLTKRVSLGLKQLRSDPWDKVTEKYPIGKRVRGKITNVTDYGAFIEVEPGIEGLVHVSEMDWKGKGPLPLKMLRVGQYAMVSVLDLSKSRRRISLGMKQCMSSSWLLMAKILSKTDWLVVIIKKPTKLGVLTVLPLRLAGLVYLPHVMQVCAVKPWFGVGVVEASIVNVNLSKGVISLTAHDIYFNHFFQRLKMLINHVGFAVKSVIRHTLYTKFYAYNIKDQTNTIAVVHSVLLIQRSIVVMVVNRQQFSLKVRSFLKTNKLVRRKYRNVKNKIGKRRKKA